MNPERETQSLVQPPEDGGNKTVKTTPERNLRRKFSKQLAPELRQETARQLREARKKPVTFEEAKKFSGEFRDPKIEKDVSEMKRNIFGRWFNTWDYRELKGDLEERLKLERKWDVENAKINFEKKFEKVLRNSPLTEEEQRKYLSEETIISMPLDDYLVLLKRLSGNFVSHVTRYGIREQTFLYHSVGKGEFFTSFTDILKAKKLHSFFTNFVENPDAFKSIRANAKRWIQESGMKGEELLNQLLAYYSSGNMPADKDSVHVAVNNIASSHYGSEKGYNFFFYFPAEFVAYNYYHHGRQEGELEHKEWTGYDQYNDMGIWNGGNGLPIDAGITCIPADVMVDRETGSQYKIVDGKPVIGADDEFVKAENPIRSHEYWENYFSEHPEQKPSKVLYGGLSTSAVGPSYHELLQAKYFRSEKDIHGYEKQYQQIYNQFRDKMREVATSLEKEFGGEKSASIAN